MALGRLFEWVDRRASLADRIRRTRLKEDSTITRTQVSQAFTAFLEILHQELPRAEAGRIVDIISRRFAETGATFP